jgi:hypothetical protein
MKSISVHHSQSGIQKLLLAAAAPIRESDNLTSSRPFPNRKAEDIELHPLFHSRGTPSTERLLSVFDAGRHMDIASIEE